METVGLGLTGPNQCQGREPFRKKEKKKKNSSLFLDGPVGKPRSNGSWIWRKRPPRCGQVEKRVQLTGSNDQGQIGRAERRKKNLVT
jgi:hypothetical protein